MTLQSRRATHPDHPDVPIGAVGVRAAGIVVPLLLAVAALVGCEGGDTGHADAAILITRTTTSTTTPTAAAPTTAVPTAAAAPTAPVVCGTCTLDGQVGPSC